MPAQFENGRKFDDKNSLQDLMPKNSTYTLRIDLSRSKSVEKCSVFIFVECLNDAVSNLCRLRFRFQNLPFSKSAGKKMCRFRVNRRPIRHIFHRFQNLPASCERSLRHAQKICCSQKSKKSSHFNPGGDYCPWIPGRRYPRAIIHLVRS